MPDPHHGWQPAGRLNREMAKLKSFKQYLESGMARRGTRDIDLAKASIAHAARRLKYASSQELNGETAPFLFEDLCEVMRECVTGLMTADGYSSHYQEASVAFLEEHYRDYLGETMIRAYGQFTGVRNDIIYRDIIVRVEQTAEAMDIAREFMRVVRDIVDAKSKIPA